MSKANIKKSILLLIAVFLLILAIQVMKEGARGLGFYLRNMFDLKNPINTLGFGWLSATLILSGSPIAASALAFFDAGALDEIEAFTMLNGSRFGVSFAILLIGFVYHLRGHERHTSISLGILTLLVTYSIYPIGIVIGIFMLRQGILDSLQFSLPSFFSYGIGILFDPIIRMLIGNLRGWIVFVLGVAILIVSFKLFDETLPKVQLQETRFREAPRYTYRPWVMFFLGFLVTLITPSVSVSLGLLVPLSARGYVKVENLIPYVMGANISTFSDTLVVAVLLNNPGAFTIVIVEIVSMILASMIVLLTSFHVYEKFILDGLLIISRSNRNLAIFLLMPFLTSIALMMA